MDTPETITVTIPAQVYSYDRYVCQTDEPCYLEEALQKAGYKDASVCGFGYTQINGIEYIPVNPFTCDIVREAFRKDEAIIVTLQRRPL